MPDGCDSEPPIVLDGLVRDQFGKNSRRPARKAQSMTAKLANEAFTAKAPADVIEKSRARLVAAEADIARLESRLAALA